MERVFKVRNFISVPDFGIVSEIKNEEGLLQNMTVGILVNVVKNQPGALKGGVNEAKS